MNESYNLHNVSKVEMSVRGVVIESADAHCYLTMFLSVPDKSGIHCTLLPVISVDNSTLLPILLYLGAF